MGKLFIIILVFVLCVVIIALPLYCSVNLVCWVFHIPYHLSILQAFAVSILANVLRSMLSFKIKEDE